MSGTAKKTIHTNYATHLLKADLLLMLFKASLHKKSETSKHYAQLRGSVIKGIKGFFEMK